MDIRRQWTTRLLDYCQKHGLTVRVVLDKMVSGPSVARTWTVKMIINGRGFGRGSGISVGIAKELASEMALWGLYQWRGLTSQVCQVRN
ncbi:hypothetical protein C8Q78DRAFT_766355 [Trametes maxima]|nr:hypothetical protein C8Q78DRAFT_766355 [Trametes maxima]